MAGSRAREWSITAIVQVGYYETSAVTGAGVAEVLQAGLDTNLREVWNFSIMEKAPTRALSWLKANVTMS